jgi:hypothetical protein
MGRQAYAMAAGGTAPKMRMNEAFILTGITLLLGALFLHTWVSPVTLESGSEPYKNGASLMKGDAFQIELTVENDTTVRFVLYDEGNNILSAESVVVAAGTTVSKNLEASQSGYYTYEIDTKGTGGSMELDIQRKYMIDLLPFPVGALLLAFGLYQRKADADHAMLSASSDAEGILDAELDV